MCKIRPTVNTELLFNVRTYGLCLKFLWMAVCMTFIGRLRDSPLKRKLYVYAYTTCFQILGGSLSAVITYHQEQNKPKNGICVANHTSPIDVLILACDNAYDLVRKIIYLSTYMRVFYLGQMGPACSDGNSNHWSFGAPIHTT